MASYVRVLLDKVTPSKLWDTNGQLLEALRPGSETLRNITDMFVPLMKRFSISFFWEMEKTDLKTKHDYVREHLDDERHPTVADGRIDCDSHVGGPFRR